MGEGCTNKKRGCEIHILFFKWAGTDSNRRSREATDLQSARFNHLPTYPVHR